MAMNVGSSGGSDMDVMIDINTTPLIDVMLVLLVMLIITLPIQLHSVNLNMPTGNPPPPLIKPEVVKLDIDPGSVVYWNGEAMPFLVLFGLTLLVLQPAVEFAEHLVRIVDGGDRLVRAGIDHAGPGVRPIGDHDAEFERAETRARGLVLLQVIPDFLVDGNATGPTGGRIGAALDIPREQLDGGERRCFGGFENAAIARRQPGRQLPRGHEQRIIPRDDLPAHADGLAARVVQERPGHGDHPPRPGCPPVCPKVNRGRSLVAKREPFGRIRGANGVTGKSEYWS